MSARLLTTVIVLASAAGCAAVTRVPIPVPISTLGGSRPVTPQGLYAIVEFGDGVWGQEQKRVELVGGGIGAAVADRLEVGARWYSATQADYGGDARVVRGKGRLLDLHSGRVAVAIDVARLSGQQGSSVQDDRMSGWDVALPVTLYPLSHDNSPDGRLGVYVAPRLVFESFEDRLATETSEGTMTGGSVGLRGRWKWVSLTGELTVVSTPDMSLGAQSFPSGLIVLPAMSASLMLPVDW